MIQRGFSPWLFDLERETAQQEHDALVAILRQAGAAVIYHDPALITCRGAIVLRMGKELRCGEEEALACCLHQTGVSITYRLHSEALAEGGDLLWVDRQTLAVGLGFRTNAEGLR